MASEGQAAKEQKPHATGREFIRQLMPFLSMAKPPMQVIGRSGKRFQQVILSLLSRVRRQILKLQRESGRTADDRTRIG